MTHSRIKKNPSPDGFLFEFHSYFLELLGDDLLNVVGEPRKARKVLDATNTTFLVRIPKKDDLEAIEDYRPIPFM